MLLLDVNVLLYAFREDAPAHEAYRDWLERLTASPEPFGLSDTVLASLVRLTINRRLFPIGIPIETVLGFVDALRAQPGAVDVRPGRHHWEVFTRLCRSLPMRANDVQDAWLAALAIEQGCELATADRGFARYKPVRYRHPLDD